VRGIAAARCDELPRKAVHPVEGRVGIERAQLAVAQYEAVRRRLEDDPVLLLAQAQRLVGAQPFDFGAGAHGEDLEDRLHAVQVLHQPA
jgi:hypothetical protein